MADDTVLRTKVVEEAPQAPKAYKENVPTDGDTTIEPPFTEYEREHKYPFLVDYFKLGDSWKDKMGGFEKEIDFIEGYFKDKIEQGQMQNDTNIVKDEINKIYKLNKIDKSERTTMQIERLAAYIKFLKDTDQIELNRYRYR